jgi:hypothetical protein
MYFNINYHVIQCSIVVGGDVFYLGSHQGRRASPAFFVPWQHLAHAELQPLRSNLSCSRMHPPPCPPTHLQEQPHTSWRRVDAAAVTAATLA